MISLLTIMLLSCSMFSQNPDYLLRKDYQAEKRKLTDNINNLNRLIAKQAQKIDSLSAIATGNMIIIQQQAEQLKNLSASVFDLQSRSGKIKKQADWYYIYFFGCLLLLVSVYLLSLVNVRRARAALKLELADMEILFTEKIGQELKGLMAAMKSNHEMISSHMGELQSRLAHTASALESRQGELAGMYKILQGTTEEQLLQSRQAMDSIEKSVHQSNQNFEEATGILRSMIESKMNEIDQRMVKIEQKKRE
jgi:hypothetical protein